MSRCTELEADSNCQTGITALHGRLELSKSAQTGCHQSMRLSSIIQITSIPTPVLRGMGTGMRLGRGKHRETCQCNIIYTRSVCPQALVDHYRHSSLARRHIHTLIRNRSDSKGGMGQGAPGKGKDQCQGIREGEAQARVPTTPRSCTILSRSRRFIQARACRAVRRDCCTLSMGRAA